ncbi:cation transporter [Klebsiella quasipneumoniae]
MFSDPIRAGGLLGIFSGSQGLIADGIHSLSDLVSDFVVLIANHKSKIP